jgi:hypothetical protein
MQKEAEKTKRSEEKEEEKAEKQKAAREKKPLVATAWSKKAAREKELAEERACWAEECERRSRQKQAELSERKAAREKKQAEVSEKKAAREREQAAKEAAKPEIEKAREACLSEVCALVGAEYKRQSQERPGLKPLPQNSTFEFGTINMWFEVDSEKVQDIVDKHFIQSMSRINMDK